MKKVVAVCVLVLLGAGAWYIADRLSSDAIGLALGVIFGVVAGLPAALLVMASSRRSREFDEDQRAGRAGQPGYGYPSMQQPPVIVVTGMPQQMIGGNGAANGYQVVDSTGRLALPAPQSPPTSRPYRMVGEKDEWVEEW